MTAIEIFGIICFVFVIILAGLNIKEVWDCAKYTASFPVKVLSKVIIFFYIIIILILIFCIYITII